MRNGGALHSRFAIKLFGKGCGKEPFLKGFSRSIFLHFPLFFAQFGEGAFFIFGAELAGCFSGPLLEDLMKISGPFEVAHGSDFTRGEGGACQQVARLRYFMFDHIFFWRLGKCLVPFPVESPFAVSVIGNQTLQIVSVQQIGGEVVNIQTLSFFDIFAFVSLTESAKMEYNNRVRIF